METHGTYARLGGRLTLAFETGATETFRIEDGGATLRTIAASPTLGMGSTDVLVIHIYRRVLSLSPMHSPQPQPYTAQLRVGARLDPGVTRRPQPGSSDASASFV